MAENFFGITDTGRQRDNNEDAFIAQPITGKQLILACVIDGVGGYEGGEVAAAIAQQTILDSLQTPFSDTEKSLKDTFIAANQNIYEEKVKSGEYSNMACVATLAIADIKNNKFHYAHVGDTRLYLLRDHSLIKVTKDQSFVGFLEDSGRLPEKEAMRHPKRNEIDRALGFDTQSILSSDYIETGESPFLPGDLLLLCSDGLTDMIDSKEITFILERKISLDQKGKELILAANNAGGKDNITVVLVQNNKRPVKQEAKKPVVVKKKDVEKKAPMVPQVTEPVGPAQKQPIKTQHIIANKGIIILLSALCALFLIGFLWMWWSQHSKPPLQNGFAKKQLNAQEIRLQAYINSGKSDTILLNQSTLGTAVYLTDTLWIRRDSVYLKGSGNAKLIKDSSFGDGPAIVITPQCKSIVLDSVTLQGFGIGILVANPAALKLRNTQFKNCAIAVAYKFDTDSGYMSGQFTNNRRQNDFVPKPEN
jgi:serine/threonine protein phosphatase PrpC